MKIIELGLAGAKLITPNVFQDERGFFKEFYRKESFEAHGITESFVQDNHSFSKKGVLRGMHFQQRPGQAKLVNVLIGKIYDVVVDIRPSSATFGCWEGVYLTAEAHQQLFIPIGFAHGFCVLSEEAHISYKISSPYDPLEEKSFRFDDPRVGIIWPIADPLLSPRDQSAPSFTEVFA